jgi:beta-N-acetylhexosaminidase
MLKWKRSKKHLSVALTILMISLMASSVYATSPLTETPEEQATEIVSKMTLEEKVGQMLMPDFRTWNGKNFTVMNEEVAGVISKYHLGGVILFAENVAGTEQSTRLVDGLQKASPNIPLLLSIDQEGGSIVRLQTGTNMTGNMPLGATRSTDLTYKVGKAIGEELHSLGINTNFAPDMDVNINPDNPVIGIRSFGGNPQMVADLGVAYAKGLEDAGEVATVKHFPGHGDVSTDSHTGLPLVPYDMNRLKNVELKPFQAAMDNDIDMIMSAHIQFPAVDDTKVTSLKDGSQIYLPATLSKKVMTDLVRTQMGFKGVIVTDALNMGAIADNFGTSDAVIRAINAGVDIALMPATVHGTSDIPKFDSMFNAVINAVNTQVIPLSRIDESAKRIISLKIKRGIYSPSGTTDNRTIDEKVANAMLVVGSAEHKAIETEAVNKAVTLVRNDDGILPFKLKDGDKVFIITPFSDRNALLVTGVNEVIAASNLKNITVTSNTYSTSSHVLNAANKTAMLAANYVIFGTYVYDAASKRVGSGYADNALDANTYANTNGIKMVNVSICYPYEPMYLTNAKTLIDVYGRYATGTNPALNLLGATRAIFGLINPTGKLPVDVPDPTNMTDATKNIYNFGFGLVYPQTSQDAVNLVAQAETSLKQADFDTASNFINELPDYPGKAELVARLQNIKGKLSIATLSSITIAGNKEIDEFSPDTLSYNVVLPERTVTVPTVTAIPTISAATVVVTPAATLPGTTSILVTASDRVTTRTYTINFTVIPPSITSMNNLIEIYAKDGQLSDSIVAQLTNDLKQVQHQLEKGSTTQAISFMKDVIKHLNNNGLTKVIDPTAKDALVTDAEGLIKIWQK